MRVDAAVDLRWSGEGLLFHGGAPDAPGLALDGNGRAAPSPVQAFILSLAACTAADVVETVHKMRLPLASLSVRVEGERAPEPPRRFLRLRVIYEAGGLPGEAEAKLRRAIALSQEKYCSVLHSLREDVELSTDVVLR
ncbi:MAG TPA: OsmC family protein [Longimicrobiales bacterium]|nr:OsmC family protein [Longimicrobiales bacterium]